MANELAPKVDVIENGRQVSQERIDPSVAQFIMQASQTAQLVKMRKLEESKVPTGTKSLKYSLTTEVKHIKIGPPWISFSLINSGDDDIYVSTTDEHDLLDSVAVEKDETINVDMGYAIIREIWLKSAGESTARLHAKVGRDDR